MTVKQFCEMCIELGLLRVKLWSHETTEIIFEGYFDEMTNEQKALFVDTFDCPTEEYTITLNIYK